MQDPGNLGTIVRVADWFGIDMILCSRTTADVYNPKVVQATMGAISRVRVVYCDLPSVIASVKDDVPVYGTFLDGGSIYDTELSQQGIIVMGNEGNGVSPEVGALVNRRLLIPSYPAGVPTSESLNVAMATRNNAGRIPPQGDIRYNVDKISNLWQKLRQHGSVRHVAMNSRSGRAVARHAASGIHWSRRRYNRSLKPRRWLCRALRAAVLSA